MIHAHDWLVTHTAVTLKEHLDIPLVATIHATEAGRHQGWLPEEMNKAIHTVEFWLSQEAVRVIVCSEYMRWEVNRLLDLPAARMDVVPNGVDDTMWRAQPRAIAAARSKFAGDGPLIASPAAWSTRRACSTSQRGAEAQAPAPRPQGRHRR